MLEMSKPQDAYRKELLTRSENGPRERIVLQLISNSFPTELCQYSQLLYGCWTSEFRYLCLLGPLLKSSPQSLHKVLFFFFLFLSEVHLSTHYMDINTRHITCNKNSTLRDHLFRDLQVISQLILLLFLVKYTGVFFRTYGRLWDSSLKST